MNDFVEMVEKSFENIRDALERVKERHPDWEVNPSKEYVTEVDGVIEIGVHGRLPIPMSPQALGRHIETALGRTPLHIEGGSSEIQTVAWCTGAAQGYIEAAADLGVDAYLTGEVSEQTVHVARERGLHFFAAGHHATERYGVQALGQFLARQFALEHHFYDDDNPV